MRVGAASGTVVRILDLTSLDTRLLSVPISFEPATKVSPT